EVRQHAAAMGLDGAVRFVGFLDLAGKMREAASSDIFINTSRVDNAPVALIEAAAMGLPIITTSVGGIPDLLTHGETALLVPDDDDRALDAAVESLVKNPYLAQRLSINGRELALRCSWQQLRPQWELVFADLTGRPSRAKLDRPLASAGAGPW